MIPILKYGELADGLITPPFSYPDILTPKNKSQAIAGQAAALKKLHENVQIQIFIEDTYIERDFYRIPIRIYYPAGEGPHPIMLHYHGGGWCLCSIDTHDYQCRYYAKNGNSVVVSVGYRLAPEYKFPEGLKDCYAALLWVERNAEKIGGDPSRLCVCGDSAGGNLATVVALMARDSAGPKISKQILVYPATDLTPHSTFSHEKYGKTPTLDLGFINKCMQMYVKRREELYLPYVSPYYAGSYFGLPSALFILAECDLLVDDGINYAKALEESGVDIKCKVYEGMPHAFFDYPYEKTFEAMNDIIEELKKI